jgi:hypothetical protein
MIRYLHGFLGLRKTWVKHGPLDQCHHENSSGAGSWEKDLLPIAAKDGLVLLFVLFSRFCMIFLFGFSTFLCSTFQLVKLASSTTCSMKVHARSLCLTGDA